MILRRLGNKKKIAGKIIKYFPPHNYYIEPFFGAGGIFFYKPKAKYNTVNDLDSEVFNLFQVTRNRSIDLKKEWLKVPMHIDLWNYWKENKEKEPIQKALRFIYLSNFGYMGQPQTLRYNGHNTSQIIYNNIDKASKLLFNVEFMNHDFEDMFKKIPFKVESDKKKAFIYCDPPYLDTQNNYNTNFNKEDSIRLFEVLKTTNIKWAMSEFDHPFILKEVRERKLNIITIGERRSLKDRRTEILITNYQPSIKLFEF